MRLTNVAHLRLPFGRLYGYATTPGEQGAELPLSFDQRRHVGAGDRAGSWTALSLTLDRPVPRERLGQAWLEVIARHGTLRTGFAPGDGNGPELHEIPMGEGRWVEHPIAPGQAPNDALREVLDATCRPFSRPSHRLCVLETAAGPTLILAADHAHVDMWSMLVLARDLLALLDPATAGVVPAAVPAFAEHTRALAARESAPAEVHRRWAEILGAGDDVMPRFPLPLGESLPQPERVEVRDVLDVDEAAAFATRARAEGSSTLGLTVSAMVAVTRELAGSPLRAVFPVHSRYEPAWHDSVGWFITNSVLEADDPEPAACTAAVKEAIHLGSWPLEDVLRPWGGMPEAPGMFAVSWLAMNRLPVRLDSTALEAQYVSATTRTDGVMLWLVLDDAGLHLRCRYPDTLEARQNVGGWLDGLIRRLQELGRTGVGEVLETSGGTMRIQRASREDVPAIVALLADDELGRQREVEDRDRYDRAFDLIDRDDAQFLAVVRQEDGTVVGTMQLSVLPGLSRGGTTRLQIEGVRVDDSVRSHGVGAAMLDWAHRHGRARGATLAQLTTDRSRDRAHLFYERLGYVDSHLGLKRSL
ncbi:GNAT family N-acetyltransferase [Brachybacterium sp. AOP43-C2-M15]|uniref:GNAT family N-acetyltransferase n=1 Tax=Brachybacterium sp. AOP43-C2-M15 TaxID=3457661 RepID=UPI0040340A17